jgi:hypothetical protein
MQGKINNYDVSLEDMDVSCQKMECVMHLLLLIDVDLLLEEILEKGQLDLNSVS